MDRRDTSYDYRIKFIMIGNYGVGKSSIVNRYISNTFNPCHISTIGIDFGVKQTRVNNCEIRQQIWDTSGADRWRSLIRAYYRGAKGICLVFDLTNKESFIGLKQWLNEIDDHADSNSHIILVGTNSDQLDKIAVTQDEINIFCQIRNMPYAAISSANNMLFLFIKY